MKNLRTRLKEQLNSEDGVTIVELLVVIAVIGIAMIPASTALMNGMNTYAVENENMVRVYDAQSTLDYITDMVRFNADQKIDIVDPSAVAVLISDFPDTAAVGKVLVINTVAIYHNGTDTIYEFEKNAPTVLLENATALTFDHIEKVTKKVVSAEDTTTEDKLSRFDVAIALEKREYGDELFKTTIYLRNK